uniref:DUF19 domain-containing protein n=1 Tax=Strongyloides papillosus TaxID=174720 RepID=A0A0N5BF14_STREA
MTFPNYMDFVDARGQLEFAAPHDNFIKDCTVQSRLTSCLGTAVSCVNSTDLLKIFKFNKHDNRDYTGDYYMSTYKCTTAYSYITSNYNCLTTADHLSKDAITKCFSDMLTSSEDKMCEAGNTLIQCLDAIYSSYCGPKAADFVCNVAKIDMTYDIPQCADKIMKCNPL